MDERERHVLCLVLELKESSEGHVGARLRGRRDDQVRAMAFCHYLPEMSHPLIWPTYSRSSLSHLAHPHEKGQPQAGEMAKRLLCPYFEHLFR